MADELFTFKLDESSVDILGERILEATNANINKTLTAIKAAWQAEFLRQHKILQSVWVPLKLTPQNRSYYDRKLREYQEGKIQYLRMLTRNGHMLAGYIHGISIDAVNKSVSIPFPAGYEERAEVHQGFRALPIGVLAHRPFEVDKFEDIAISIADELI